MSLNKHLMAQMTWPELKQAVGEGRIAVMPAGIIEQHGPALPLDTDIFLADEVTRRAAARVADKVVVVPPIVHGHSPHHMDFPGTLTVDPQHMLNYVLDVCLSLAQHGFTKLLIVNGHGSNAPVLDLVARQAIIRTEGRMACASLFFMDSHHYHKLCKELFPAEYGRWGHADAIETSLYMGLRPDLVQADKAQDNPLGDTMALGSATLPLRLWWSSFSREGIGGVVGNISEAKGRQLVEAAVHGLAEVMREFYDKQIPPRVDHH